MTELERDIHRLWQDQSREERTMSIDEVRSKAARFERKVRRANIITGGLFVLLIAVEAWQVWREPALLERVGDLLTIAAFVYAIYWFRGRVRVQSMPAGLGFTSSVEFYRMQLARQRDLAASPWRYLALFVPGVALALLGRTFDRPAGQTAAIAAFGVLLFLAVAWVHQRNARRLQHEIDELG
jgi:hypothetical protein